MDMGADDYLTKPFEEEEFISAVESRLAKTAIIYTNVKIIKEMTSKSLKILKNSKSILKLTT